MGSTQIAEVETIILRFRDLVTGPGGTVDQHNAISKEIEHVWWGWWNKFGEQVPVSLFTSLAERIAKQGPFCLLLLDTGQNQIYQATCSEIRWDPGRAEVPSPEPGRTPSYYSTSKYYAWFKLGKITDFAAGNLKQFSYVGIDEFFKDSRSNYGEFYGKQVYSPEELQQQNRTIWFVRKYKAGDQTHFVRLYNANRLAPSDFPDRVLITKNSKLLWLSDVHFSADHHAFPSKPNDNENDLCTALEESVKGSDLAGLLVSGDLTWKTDPAEFQQFADFVRDFMSRTRLDNNYFVTICPGNHDVRFTPPTVEKGSDPGPATPEAQQAYRKMYNEIFFLEPNEYLCSGRRYVLKEGIPLEVVSLNSSRLQQYQEKFQGHGFVGALQLKFAAQQMGWDKMRGSENQAYRVLMLHHHLLPVTYREAAKVDVPTSIAYDANAIIEWVAKHQIDLVLHGHQHQPFCAKLSYPRRKEDKPDGEIEEWHEFYVLGLGSSGVKLEHLGETKTNTYAILDAKSDCLEISVHPISPIRSTNFRKLWNVSVPRRLK